MSMDSAGQQPICLLEEAEHDGVTVVVVRA
jgi:hypothetical protein